MFAGIFVRQGFQSPREFATQQMLINVLTPYQQADVVGGWENEKVLIVQALTWNTAESKQEAAPYQCPHSKLLIASWLRLDNRDELCKKLGLAENITLTDPMLVIAAYRRWGHDCANRLEGDFSFVIYDPSRHECFAARDSLGVKPFFYYCSSEMFIFASTAAVFPILEKLSIRPSEEWVARYLIGLSIDLVKTAYENVKKLPPAHLVKIDRFESVKPERYFLFQDTAPKTYKRDGKLIDEYRDKFHSAVESRLRSDYLIGAESSGGLDSSTIVAHASENVWHGKEHFHCFGFYNLEHESKYILETAMHCGIKHNHIAIQPNSWITEKEMHRVIRVMGFPSEHNHPISLVAFYELCETFGIRSLLSGFGGDEMVTHPAKFLFQELLLAGKYHLLFEEFPGNAAKRLLDLVRLIIKKKSIAKQSNLLKRINKSILRSEVFNEYNISALSDFYFCQENSKTLNEYILNSRSWNGYLLGRLESSALMANSYRIEYRKPLLDRALMKQYLDTPAIYKHHKQMGRYLHRIANVGKVPDKILWKETKDFGSLLHFDRNKFRDIMPNIDVEELSPFLAQMIDKDKLYAQKKSFDFCMKSGNVADWLACRIERNNLRALSALNLWLMDYS